MQYNLILHTLQNNSIHYFLVKALLVNCLKTPISKEQMGHSLGLCEDWQYCNIFVEDFIQRDFFTYQ